MQLLPGTTLPVDPDTEHAEREPQRSSDGPDQGGDEPRFLHEPLNKPWYLFMAWKERVAKLV